MSEVYISTISVGGGESREDVFQDRIVVIETAPPEPGWVAPEFRGPYRRIDDIVEEVRIGQSVIKPAENTQ